MSCTIFHALERPALGRADDPAPPGAIDALGGLGVDGITTADPRLFSTPAP